MNTCCPTDRLGVFAIPNPQGTTLENGDYVTGPIDAKFGIIYAHDIYGLSAQAFRVADAIAFTGGFRLYIPDFFNGEPWPLDKPLVGDFMDFLARNDWETVVRSGFLEAISYLKKGGVEKIASVGFCWGAKMCVTALVEKLVIAVASPHPSLLDAGEECATGLPGPVCFILSKDEGPYTPWYKAVEEAPENLRQLSHLSRFDTMHHGFMGGRCDFSDKENEQKADEGVQIFVNFLTGVFAANL